MLEANTVITLENDKKYTVLRVMDYNNKKYALISDLKKENYVVNVETDEKGVAISLINNEKEEQLIASKFLKDSIEDLNKLKAEMNNMGNEEAGK